MCHVLDQQEHPLPEPASGGGLLTFFAVLGPGIIVMVADNDAGGISTYAVTGSKYGFTLLWIFLLLIPMAYFVQEMTVRLGAVTKRGHAEAIFDGFGPFWGWFSLVDLAIVNWLTLITEYIGMTAAMSLFGVPPLDHVRRWSPPILFAIVLSGKYWTFEKITLLFCAFNLVYIPAALWAMETPTAPGWGSGVRGVRARSFPGGFTGELIFIMLANIGTTITPWQIFFQQSAVVDKGLDVHDIKYGKIDTLVGHDADLPGGGLHHHHDRRRVLLPPAADRDRGRQADRRGAGAAPAARRGAAGAQAVRHRPVRRRVPGRAVHLAVDLLGRRRGLRLGALAQQERARRALVLRRLPRHAADRRRRRADPRCAARHDHDVRPGGGRHAAAVAAGVPADPPERPAATWGSTSTPSGRT